MRGAVGQKATELRRRACASVTVSYCLSLSSARLGHVVDGGEHVRRLGDRGGVLRDGMHDEGEHVVLVPRLIMVGVEPVHDDLHQPIGLVRLRLAEHHREVPATTHGRRCEKV